MRRTLAFVVCAALGGASPALAAEENWKARIETLERALAEEKARAAREREESEKRLRSLEEQLRALQGAGVAAAPPAAPPTAPVASLPRIPGILNPAISVIGNVVFRGSDTKIFNDEGDRIDNRAHLREAELDMRAAIDPYADAVFIVAHESESPGEFEVGVEEGYATLRRLPFLDHPPLGAQLKLGRFRPAFGRINILHTHDLPQTERPLVIREFLGDEGFVGDGVSTQLSLPTWDDESALDLVLQATTGDVAIASGGRNDTGFLGHLRWFRQMTDASSLEAGWSSYYARTETPVRESWMHGTDLLYRWKPLRGGEFRSFLLGGEVLFADREFDETLEAEDETAEPTTVLRRTDPIGAYGFAQYQPAARWYLGVRGDWTETIDDDDATRRGVTPYVSYYFSEFLRFRLNYEHVWSDLAEEDARNAVFLEANFVFGSHPPEPFWVNK